MSSRRAETPMAFVRAMLLGYEKYGVDPRNALRHAGISVAQVRRPDARITSGQMETIAASAMQELDDEALGWFSRKLPWGTYGMLCRASLGAPTLGVALKRWCRHHRLLTADVRMRLDVERGTARFVVEEARALGAMREFCLLTTLRYVHGYGCWLVNSRLPLRDVTFPFTSPPHAETYRYLFPGPSRFDAATTSISFDAGYLDLAPKRDENALAVMLKRALPLTVRQYQRDRLLVERVREVLRTASGGSATTAEKGLVLSDARVRAVTAEAIAERLHVSVRSLHRQLATEGASLQAIKDDVRQRRAIELLERTAMSIKEVAQAVGFTNEKSFSRAFKTWTGAAPSEQRRARNVQTRGAYDQQRRRLD